MNIVVVGTRGFPDIQGGVESHCENLYAAIAKKGVNVMVFIRKPYSTLGLQKYKGITLLPVNCPKKKYYETVIHTCRCILIAKKLKPDILHIHTIGASFFAIYAKGLGMNVVVTHHGPDYLRAKWHFLAKEVLKLCEIVGMKSADRVIAITQEIADSVHNKFHKKCSVIPNGVKISPVLKSEGGKILETFSLKKNRYILVVGRFVPEKGFIDLINAFNSKDFEGWKLAIVGGADHEDKYTRKVAAMAGENPDIVLTGILTGKELRVLYSNARLFVLPSYFEGLPIVLLEALSYGLSCIASDIPGNKIGLSPDRYFTAGSTHQLRAKMQEFIDKPWNEDERRKQIDFITEKFNWERIADDTLNVYKSLINSSVSVDHKRSLKRNVRIAVLGTRGFPNVQGGVEIHCQNLYVQLAKRGYDITVFTRKPYVDSTLMSYENVALESIPCPRNKYLEAFTHTIVGLWKARKIQPDILHLHAIGPSFFAPLARLLGMKVVVTHHGENYKHQKWGYISKKLLMLCEAIGMKYANNIIVLTDYLASSLWEKFKRLSEVIPNGVNIPSASSNGDYELLDKLGIEKDNYILSVGRFVPEKGFMDLIEAYSNGDFNGMKLVIVGGADHEDSFTQELRNKASQNQHIVLTGILTGTHLEAVYRNASLFILPSYYEGLPLVLLEAMSHGLSCIASDIDANKILELSNDRYYRVGDIEMMRLKIKDFINRTWTEKDRQKEIADIAEKYNWDSIADKTEKIYMQTI